MKKLTLSLLIAGSVTPAFAQTWSPVPGIPPSYPPPVAEPYYVPQPMQVPQIHIKRFAPVPSMDPRNLPGWQRLDIDADED